MPKDLWTISILLLSLMPCKALPSSIPELFLEATVGENEPSDSQLPTASLDVQKFVKLNPVIMKELRNSPAKWKPFVVNISETRVLMLTSDYTEVDLYTFRWTATNRHGDKLMVILENDIATGELTIGADIYHIYSTTSHNDDSSRISAGENLYRVVEFASTKQLEGPDTLEDPVFAPQTQLSPAPCDAQQHGGSKKEFHPSIMIMWTPAARSWLDSQGRSILSEVQMIIALMSSAMTGRSFRVSPNLVWAQEIAHTEMAPELEPDLKALTSGAIAGVHDFRDRKRADLVMLIGHWPKAKECGLAWVNDKGLSADVSAYGYSASNVDVDGDYYCDFPLTPVHEVGHNLGLRHDRANNNHSPATSYNFGFVDLTARIRTIMAYDSQCTNKGFSCKQVERFSTPNELGPRGAKLGTEPSENNLEMLCRMATVVEQFR